MTGKILHGETEQVPSGQYKTTIKLRDHGRVFAYGASSKESLRAALHKACLAVDCPHIFAVKSQNREKVCTKCGLLKADQFTAV